MSSGSRIIYAAIQAAGAFARRVRAHFRRRQRARVVYDILRRLDDRTLRDLGFDRSELTSIAAEITGRAMHARVRTTSNYQGEAS